MPPPFYWLSRTCCNRLTTVAIKEQARTVPTGNPRKKLSACFTDRYWQCKRNRLLKKERDGNTVPVPRQCISMYHAGTVHTSQEHLGWEIPNNAGDKDERIRTAVMPYSRRDAIQILLSILSSWILRVRVLRPIPNKTAASFLRPRVCCKAV